MRTATASLKSISPYSPSRFHDSPKLDREAPDAYDLRTWKEHGHYTKDGNMFSPPMGFKYGLDRAAQMLGIKVKGKGQSTYSKFFVSGVMCIEGPVLPITRETVECEKIYAHANGKRGSGTRVWRRFPKISEWSAYVQFHVLANEIEEDMFREHLVQAGSFVGIGRFRPENGGYFGRYSVEDIAWN